MSAVHDNHVYPSVTESNRYIREGKRREEEASNVDKVASIGYKWVVSIERVN